MATPTYDADGKKATTTVKLDDNIFALEVQNHDLLKQAYTAYVSNGRTRNAATKTRGEVSGGGKKPWKQKGTGRARFGSSRNPIWRGGGIAFGPTGQENFIKSVNVKAKRTAIRQALSLAHTENKIIIVKDFVAKDGKVSAATALLSKIGAQRRTLVVTAALNDDIVRATNNLPDVKLIQAAYLNVYDAMNADTIVVTHTTLEVITAWLGEKTDTKEAAK